MGYTHYWSLAAFTLHSEKPYKKALTECRKIIKASPVPLGNWKGEGKPKLNGEISINGYGKDMCESFILPEIPKGDLCKTNNQPYDVVVVACLCILQEQLGRNIQVRSDGDPDEWEEGRVLASKVLGREIKIPQSVIDQTGMYGWAAKMYRKKHPEYEYTPLDDSHPDHMNENVPDYAKE